MIASGQISSRERKEGGNKGGRRRRRQEGERERWEALRKEVSLSLSRSLSVCPTCRLLLLLPPVFLGFLAAGDWLEEFQLVFRLPFGFEHGLRLNSYAH